MNILAIIVVSAIIIYVNKVAFRKIDDLEYLFIFASLVVLGTIIYIVADTVKHFDNKIQH